MQDVSYFCYLPLSEMTGATEAAVLLCLRGDLNNITRDETHTQIRTPVSQSGRHRAVPLHALFGFKGLVLNMDGSVLVTCSAGVLENQPRSDSQL